MLLKTNGLKAGDKVLSNAFTFGAVPSAIKHAGGKAVYVESNKDHVINVEDLEKKLKENPDCRHILISHMRGKVAAMDAIKNTYVTNTMMTFFSRTVLTHSGVQWQGQHTGHKGVACAMSSQRYKMIHSGEGGFLADE